MARKATKQRPVWKGLIKIGLVTFPVRALSARIKAKSEVDLDWLHRDCHRRIQYKKICPVHGEVKQSDIVSGYALGRGKYVVIEPEELAKLRAKSDKIMTVESMVDEGAIDCRFFTEKTYYVLPDGNVAERPYAVIADAMDEQGRAAIVRIVMFRREQLALVRVVDGVFIMTVLNHESEFQEPARFAAQAPKAHGSRRERDMAAALVEAMSDRQFDFASYKDEYVEELQKLIRLKAEGKEIEAPAEEEEPEVVNLMEALKASLAGVSNGSARPARQAHRGHAAPRSSHGRRRRQQRRRAS